MNRRIGARRKLRAESLESRQLLHGGALAEVDEPPTTADRVECTFQQFDANEDAMLTEDEVSERLWSRISEADTDENSAISSDELTAHLEAEAAERVENGEGELRDHKRGGHGGRTQRDDPGPRLTTEERIDAFFANNDANEDGLITVDEVSERQWERILEADLNDDGISSEELLVLHETRQQERFDAQFARLDANEDGGVTEDEVTERAWSRISEADSDDDGSVTSQELQDYLEALRAEREAEEDEAGEMDGETVEGGEAVAVGEAIANGGRVARGNRSRGRR